MDKICNGTDGLRGRTFLPCPQLSLLGAFSGSGASPTKQDQLLLALAPSVVLMGLAVLLNAQATWMDLGPLGV